MALDRITLTNFRNHPATRIDGTAKLNLLTGENGAGKTNVLEALSLLAPGRGLRRATLVDMATAGGMEGFGIGADLVPGDRGNAVRLSTRTTADRPSQRQVQINGANASAAMLGEWLAISWLTPAMDSLFTDSSGARRRYMDRLALALHPGHARTTSRYESALRERNRLLSDDPEPDPRWLDAVEGQMAEAGAALAQGRALLIERLTGALNLLPAEPFARPALTYLSGSAAEPEALAAELARSRQRDRAARRTLAGPHRDELEVAMAGTGTAAAHCSTGEQKAMLIAITLAHAELATAGRPGLLLLDEVAAHLDPIRRETLFERLNAGSAQVWLTGTEMAPFAAAGSGAAAWQVESGAVKRL